MTARTGQGAFVVQTSGTGHGGSARTGPPEAPHAAPASAAPRRLRAPSWLNFRLIAGVLLVLVSVIAGARVVTAANTSDLVWAAESDLAAGTVLTSDDIRAVSVRLADTGGSYLPSSSDPAGSVLNSPIGAGELLPRSILTETSSLVDIALPIAAGFVPPSLQRGQLVDVYAIDTTPDSSPAAPGIPGATQEETEESPSSEIVRLVVRAAVVQLIAGRGDGALSLGSSTIQVVISVEADRAAGVFAAIAGRQLALAARSSASRPGAEETPTRSRTTPTPTPATPTD